MNEAVTFWMENKSCVGTAVVASGDQLLVSYRDRYYLLREGAAVTRGGKPLRFSVSTLPAVWKRALKGDLSLTETLPAAVTPVTGITPPKRERKKSEQFAMAEPVPENSIITIEPAAGATARPRKKTEAQGALHPPVAANCPYCNTRHEIPLEKGKNGKPFFIPCSKCRTEFAVRFVQVTVYQAQVAGFR